MANERYNGLLNKMYRNKKLLAFRCALVISPPFIFRITTANTFTSLTLSIRLAVIVCTDYHYYPTSAIVYAACVVLYTHSPESSSTIGVKNALLVLASPGGSAKLAGALGNAAFSTDAKPASTPNVQTVTVIQTTRDSQYVLLSFSFFLCLLCVFRLGCV